jgi:hypothetical protein
MKKTYRLIAILTSLLIPFSALANDWEWTTKPTPGSQNEVVSEDGDTMQDYSNGTLSNAIILSEVMPNPEGTDNDTEWIELYNTGTINVDLGNWALDDEEGGSSPYTFPTGTMIEAQDFLVIYREFSKISLNNDTDEIRLFDFEGTIQDSVIYDGSPEGQSYARISLEAPANKKSALARLIPTAHAEAWYEAPWEWTQDITQGTTNPIYHAISGTVLEWIPFKDQIQIQNNDQILTISLSALNLNPELKQSIFNVGNQIQGYATVTDNHFELKRFEEIVTAPLSNTSPSRKNLYLTLTLICGGTILLIRKKSKQKVAKTFKLG